MTADSYMSKRKAYHNLPIPAAHNTADRIGTDDPAPKHTRDRIGIVLVLPFV